MHKLQVADVKFLIFMQQQYLCYKKWPVSGSMIDTYIILRILETFVKKLDIMVAEWDLKPCRWLEQGWVFKS